jgi:hypothetical protein
MFACEIKKNLHPVVMSMPNNLISDSPGLVPLERRGGQMEDGGQREKLRRNPIFCCLLFAEK